MEVVTFDVISGSQSARPYTQKELSKINHESLTASVIRQIEELEAKQTPRRIREALLSGDHSFIESIEAQIAALRSQLA